MRNLREITIIALLVIILLLSGAPLSAGEKEDREMFVSTSVFCLSSLLPDVRFYELDLGIQLNSRHAVSLGLDYYRYSSPLSAPWESEPIYPGKVDSVGLILTWQVTFLKHFYISQLVNPLMLFYIDDADPDPVTGFMLLLANRIGYRFEFPAGRHTLFLEAGGEINYWPINTHVPAGFKAEDDRFNSFTCAPSLNIGLTL